MLGIELGTVQAQQGSSARACAARCSFERARWRMGAPEAMGLYALHGTQPCQLHETFKTSLIRHVAVHKSSQLAVVLAMC